MTAKKKHILLYSYYGNCT